MKARVAQAKRRKNAHELRVILREIGAEASPADFEAARTAARDAFMEYYDRAKERMVGPAAGGEREFPVDEALRGAFATVLEDLAGAAEPTIHVAFTNTVDVTAPEGTEAMLEMYRADPQAKAAFPAGAPIIDAGDAFSDKYDARRRGTFMQAMNESFGQVFDADLLALQPLAAGEATAGKLVIEVSSEIYRQPSFYFYDKSDAAGRTQLAGLMFAIGVRWRFRLLDRDGTVLYAPEPIDSNPAGEVSVNTGLGDPDWAMYSVMMDSAYYNYARSMVGRFGLVPPPQKQAFGYTGI